VPASGLTQEVGIEHYIERADIETHHTLTEIAQAAKRHWGYPERWMELWRDVLTITPDYIAGNEVYVARVGDAIVGFYALMGSGAKLTLDHLWLSPAQIGAGLGRTLFAHAVATAKQLGATEIEIEAEPYAVGFYERMGATRVGENQYELDGQPRILPLLVYQLA
jgi:GNAT superfamily N-acetyltransferase